MRIRRRPWGPSQVPDRSRPFGPRDSMVVEFDRGEVLPRASAPLPGLSQDGARFHELPLPPANNVVPCEGIPRRPRIGIEPNTEEDRIADTALDRMVQILARVHELEFAADDPVHVWDRLDAFWKAAEGDDAILVSEIVRQSAYMPALLDILMGRLRRVLRRERDLVGLDRVQEMDTASLEWLTKQPGRTLAERAGPAQRIQAVVRKESFDTGENRVLHAWSRLAGAEARDWVRHNKRAASSQRFRQVERLALRARRAARELSDLGVGVAEPGIMPNFVLTQDIDYRRVQRAWIALLREKREIDDLWAWQGRSFSDFGALAVTLALRGIEGAELIASCPLAKFADHDRGAWFGADTPLAVYHLRRQSLVVEVQYRPEHVAAGQDALAAALWLRIGGLAQTDPVRRLPVWTRLVFDKIDLEQEATDCATSLAPVARQQGISRGIILVSDPNSGSAVASKGDAAVSSLGIGPSGAPLRNGLDRIGKILREEAGAEVAQ